MRNIYKNIDEYNPNKKREIIIDFDEMIGDMPRNKKLDPTVTELVIRVGNSNIYFVFAFNHSLDIDFKDFMNLYKKYTAKSHAFL